MKKIIFIISLILSAGALAAHHSAFADDIKFEASLDKKKVAIGDTAQLGLSFYGTQSMPAPDIGNIDGLEIRYNGPSSMMTVLNGQISSSVTHMYTVVPLKTGRFQIGPFSFKYKGNNYTSNITFLDVSEESVSKQEPKESPLPEEMNLDDRMFVTLDVGKLAAYVNELIPVTVKLFVNRLNVSDIQLPTFAQEGFSKIEFREPKQYRENLNGMLYDVLEFKTNIFGTKPGEYKLGPAKIKSNIMVKKNIAKAQVQEDPFGGSAFKDSFFDDFFTRYERHPVELSSQEAHIIISPLPTEGRPSDFSGAVGDYQFIFNASPTKLKVGDPITLRMDVNGTGNFNTVLSPKLDNVTGFRVYEPQVKTENNSKTFRQVLIPETDQVTQVPAAKFVYFNPAKKEYITIKQGPVSLQVEKGKEEAPSQVIGPLPSVTIAPGPEGETLGRDIIYIKESPGKLANKGYGLYKSKIFIIIVTLPLIIFISLYFAEAKRNRMKTDMVYAGRRHALKAARKGLKALRRQALSDDPKIFYETLFKALQNYIGNRIRIPPAGITSDIVEHLLSSNKIESAMLHNIKNLFETCDNVRFASSKPDGYKMQDDIKELEEIIKYFERRKV